MRTISFFPIFFFYGFNRTQCFLQETLLNKYLQKVHEKTSFYKSTANGIKFVLSNSIENYWEVFLSWPRFFHTFFHLRLDQIEPIDEQLSEYDNTWYDKKVW